MDTLAIPKMLLSQVNLFLKKHNYNLDELEKDGYKINYDFYNCNLEVKYHRKNYVIKIIEKDNRFYWHLDPYNQSYFETEVDNTYSKLDYVLFAIKEDFDLFKERTNND